MHQGSEKVGQKRNKLKCKKEFVSLSNKKVRQAVVDYIYNTYHITKDTKLITVSDGGKGFSPEIFSELAKDINIRKHEHFFDVYHVFDTIQRAYRFLEDDIKDMLIKALKESDKQLLICALDTAESMIEDDSYLEEFRKFSKKVKRYFKYMIFPWKRGISSSGIGIIESQHRKITYRMKNRGMYWGRVGIKGMTNLIIKVYDNTLRELFFGDWREKYAYYKKLETGKVHGINKQTTEKDINKNSRIFNTCIKSISMKGNLF